MNDSVPRHEQRMPSGSPDQNRNRQYQHDRFSGWPAVIAVIAVLLLWAVLLAIGTMIGGRFLPGRPVILLLTMLAFSTFWIVAVQVRNRSRRRP